MKIRQGRYQALSRDTYKKVKCSDDGIAYLVMGLLGEAGEVANKVKKIYRDKDGNYEAADIAELKSEIGDVFWYLTQICTNLGLSIEDVAQQNYDKLQDRKNRGVIHGSGDNR